MKTYEALVRVVHMETWTVDAEDEAEARKKISDLTEDVETDKAGGEVVDWEVYNIKDATDQYARLNVHLLHPYFAVMMEEIVIMKFYKERSILWIASAN